MQLECRLARVQCRRHVVPGHLQQRGTLQCGVAAATERFLQTGGHLWRGKIAVGWCHDKRGTGDDAQYLAHARTRLQHGDAAGGEMTLVGIAISRLGELRIAFGRDLTAPHRLHVGHQVEQIVDRRIMRRQAHRMRAGQRQAQRELRLRQPAIQLMPEQPAGDQLGRRIHQEHAFPRNMHVVEPHLPVQLVIAAAERRGERIGIARGDPAADDRDARRTHRHDEGRAVLVVVDAAMRTDIHILGIGGAGVHADLAAQHHARVGLPHDAQRGAIGGIGAHAIADGGGARGECEEAAGADDLLAIRFGIVDLLRRGIALLHLAEDAECDQMPIGWRVRDVAGAEEGRRREAASHADEIVRALRQHVAPGQAVSGQDDVLPRGIEMPVVPGNVFIDHGARRRMRGDVVDGAFADDPDLAPVAQRIAVLGAGPQFVHLGRLRVADRAPDAIAGRRHVEFAHTERFQRMHDGVHHRGHRAHTAGLAGTLRTQRVAFGRHRVGDDAHAAHVIGARHAVVHETRSQQLAGFRFVDHLLHQDLADALARRRHEFAQPASAD